MNTARTGATAKSIVDDVFGRSLSREVWTGNYEEVLPLTVGGFDLTAVLPAVFYMFRFGYRRGKGKFLQVFGGEGGTSKERKRIATIDHIASILATTDGFEAFESDDARAIFADLLLGIGHGIAKRALGR